MKSSKISATRLSLIFTFIAVIYLFLYFILMRSLENIQ